MKKLGPVLETLLRRHNLWYGYKQYLLVESWDSIVGPALAEVTKAEAIREGVMRVNVKDSVWSYHLSMMKPKLIKKLNTYAECRMVRDIYFVIGEIENEGTEIKK